jgi:branched-chain amino acid transport system ATP-binding protein
MSSEALLQASGLVKRYGGLHALDDVSLSVGEGEIVGLIGPNGSGKTTFINAISGAVYADSGRVDFDGHNVTKMASHRRAHRGINRTYQIPAPFHQLTVSENVLVAATYGRRGGDAAQAIELARLSGLERREAASLNSTQQKMLDLARALATRPRLLLVDEIAAGLNPDEARQIATLLQELAASGITLLVVEHLMPFLRMLATRVVVMEQGSVIFNGALEDAAEDPHVVEVFLGQASGKETNGAG